MGSKYQDSLIFGHFWGEWAYLPQSSGMCQGSWKGVEFRGSLAPFFLHLLWTKKNWSRRSTVGWVHPHTPYKWPLSRAKPHPEGRAGQLAPISGTLGVSQSPGKQASIALRGHAFSLEAEPGSLIALRGSLARLWEGNQVLEQMVGLSLHESGGGGYLVLSRQVARTTTTWAHASARRWGETWVRSIKILWFFGRFLGGWAYSPQGSGMCQGSWKGVEFRGSLAPFFLHLLWTKKNWSRSTVGWVHPHTPYKWPLSRVKPHPEGRAGQLVPIFGTLGVS